MQRFTELVPGVLVAVADYAATTSTAVAGGGGCLLIDPAVTPADLTALAADLAGAGLPPLAGMSTHPHWDHLLWSRELGDVPRYGGAGAVALLEAERGAMEQMLEQQVPGHDLSLVGRLTALGDGAVPWDGPEARLVIHDGHAPGHAAVFLPASGVLVAGDMVSDQEIPLLDTVAQDAYGDYVTGLDRLAALDGVRWVVPGHGAVGDGAEFRRRADADRRYLDQLAAGKPFGDPRLPGGPDWMRAHHEEQLRYVAQRAGGAGAAE